MGPDAATLAKMPAQPHFALVRWFSLLAPVCRCVLHEMESRETCGTTMPDVRSLGQGDSSDLSVGPLQQGWMTAIIEQRSGAESISLISSTRIIQDELAWPALAATLEGKA
jgi:hypothetical protein